MLLFLCKSINSDSQAGGNQPMCIFSKQLGPDGISTRYSLKKKKLLGLDIVMM